MHGLQALRENRTLNIWLYIRSLMESKSVAAVLYAHCPGRNADRLTLNSCTGWVRHIGYFPESGTYVFAFETQLSKGTAEVVLLDREKRALARFGPQCPAGSIELDAKRRYTLHWDLKGVTGRCELRWRRARGQSGITPLEA